MPSSWEERTSLGNGAPLPGAAASFQRIIFGIFRTRCDHVSDVVTSRDPVCSRCWHMLGGWQLLLTPAGSLIAGQ